MLTIDEIYKTEIPFFNHGFMFDTKNIILINNEPHEILNTVLEALQKYDKKLKINLILNKNEKQKVKFIHSKINKIDKKFNLHISGKLAANFCLRYFNELK